MKKCRPVVKGPSGGTLLFCFALPARGASYRTTAQQGDAYALPRRCLHGAHLNQIQQMAKMFHFASALPARGASA